MAITPDGEVKPVSEFTAGERWWCDGEECGEEDQPPHVHCMMHRHLVDLVTGKSIEPEPGGETHPDPAGGGTGLYEHQVIF